MSPAFLPAFFMPEVSLSVQMPPRPNMAFTSEWAMTYEVILCSAVVMSMVQSTISGLPGIPYSAIASMMPLERTTP